MRDVPLFAQSPLRSDATSTPLRSARVQASADRVVGVPRQVTVVLVDRLHARAHQPRQLEDRHAGSQRLGRERMAQVVRATLLDSRCGERRIRAAPGVEVDVVIRPDNVEDMEVIRTPEGDLLGLRRTNYKVLP